jgi:hypothetical protein
MYGSHWGLGRNWRTSLELICLYSCVAFHVCSFPLQKVGPGHKARRKTQPYHQARSGSAKTQVSCWTRSKELKAHHFAVLHVLPS